MAAAVVVEAGFDYLTWPSPLHRKATPNSPSSGEPELAVDAI